MSSKDLTPVRAELEKLRSRANLSQAVAESEKLIEALVNAREEIASGKLPAKSKLDKQEKLVPQS